MSGRFATLDPMATETILAEIGEERERQDRKHGAEQNIPDGTGSITFQQLRDRAIALTDARTAKGTVTWADVLTEEVFEALAEGDREKLRTELIQSAAVCVKWVEHIDRRERVNA